MGSGFRRNDDPDRMEMRSTGVPQHSITVIPANAGTHFDLAPTSSSKNQSNRKMGSGLRRNDEPDRMEKRSAGVPQHSTTRHSGERRNPF
ncbi:hypothetical protein [Lysobacter silvisoli]|uniref:hypothetical protein n=1 Tax=Lysobacter silvisoli TaxID=2293254 RepID=UPI0011C07324|nr:hypothetical protein [Lysobacter silvisoli]